MKERVETINAILADRNADFRIEYEIVIRDNMEREGYVLHSLDEHKKNACPIIYQGEWYDSKTDYEVSDWLCAAYEQYAMCIDTGSITDPDEIRGRILPRVTSEGNAVWLDKADVNHRPFVDGIVASCYLPVEMPDGQNGCIQVTNKLLAIAGLTADEAFDYAIKNMTATIDMSSMAEMLAEMLGVPAIDEPAGVPDMTVITNTERCYGAAAIMCPVLYDRLRDRLGNDRFLILPSSIHEILVVPDVNMTGDLTMYADMVREVNDSQVAPEERLSYHVYGYQGGVLRAVA